MKQRTDKPLSGGWSKPKLDNSARLAIILGLIVLGVVLRVLPHPPNFAPITAMALFGGALLPKKAGLWLPLVAMMISDAFIGFHPLVPVTWSAFFLIAWYSHQRLSGRITGANLLVSAVSSSVFFFVVTNFAVWAQGKLYPRTLEGLSDAFVLALPFFRNTLLGDLFFSGVLFGAYYAAVHLALRLAPRVAKI